MSLDAAVIWKATRSTETLQQAKAFGVAEDLFLSQGKVAWRFIQSHREQHGSIPSPGVIGENSGLVVTPLTEENDAEMTYLVDRLHERAIFRALKYGVDKTYEHIEGGEQDEAASEVIRLADHLRERKVARVRVRDLSQIVPEVKEMYEKTKRGEIGIPFPWEVMNDMTLGMWPGTLTFFTARPGVGKCVHEDTEIIDPVTGVPRTIRGVFDNPNHAEVVSWSRKGGVRPVEITRKVDTGRKECLRFTTRTGRSITVTPEHPFLTPEGWVRAEDMRHGMSLGLPSHMPFPERPFRMKDWQVELLALLLSEGSYSGNHVGFSTTDAAILDLAQRAADVMGVDLKYRSGCDYDFVRKDTGRHPVRVLLQEHGGDRKVAKDKVIPDAIYQLPKEQLSRFLGVFWMCDGTVSKRGDVSITLASERMVRQIQSLLLRFGVQSRVAKRDIKGGYVAWRLRVFSHCVRAFVDQIPLWGQKLERAERAALAPRNPNVGSPRVSDEWVGRISAASKLRSGRWSGGLHQKVAGSLGRSGFQTRDLFGNHNAVKMTAFRGWATVYGVWDDYRWWTESGLFWDEVESVESVGVQKVYDLTVDDTHCFVANDVVVHNTWTAINICHHAWQKGYKVLVVSPEMVGVELAERVVARHGKLSYGDLVSGRLGDFGGERALEETIAELTGSEGFHVLDDEERLSSDYIEEAVEAVDPDLVAVDSVYMLKVFKGKVKKGAGSKGGRYDRILETIDWLRSFSRRTKKPVLAISQLSRDAKMKKGQAERLKQGVGTGGLEDAVAMSDTLLMDAHNLFAMFQDEDMKLDKQMLYVPLKARRQAKWSSLVTRWDMEQMNFDQIGTKVEQSDEFKDNSFDDVVF